MNETGRQWVLRCGLMAVIAGALTACGGQEASTPATSLPASTVSVQETATSSPAASAAVNNDQNSQATGAAGSEASPVTSGTPATGKASATPAAGATPVSAASAAQLAAQCPAYEAWLSDPAVATALQKSALWPDVIAQGEKAAAGEPFDTVAMGQAIDQMAKLGQELRVDDPDGNQAPLLARRAMGLTSRLASDLSKENLDPEAAGAAVTEAKAAIADYQYDAAARQAVCD